MSSRTPDMTVQLWSNRTRLSAQRLRTQDVCTECYWMRLIPFLPCCNKFK
jgi:hypothetical protein